MTCFNMYHKVIIDQHIGRKKSNVFHKMKVTTTTCTSIRKCEVSICIQCFNIAKRFNRLALKFTLNPYTFVNDAILKNINII